MPIWAMRFACWIPKATNTHTQYVILIAFPLQLWLNERSSVLRHTYMACLVRVINGDTVVAVLLKLFKVLTGEAIFNNVLI
jgi:hypothetical protein